MRAALMISAFVASVAALPAQAAVPIGNADRGLQLMRELNLIVIQDFKLTSDVEGKAYVGGKLTGSGTIGTGSDANNQSSATSWRSTLAVGGDMAGQVNLGAGNPKGLGGKYGAYLGGGATGTLTLNQNDGTVRVRGNYAGSLGSAKSGTTLIVSGNVGGIDLAGNANVRVGGNVTGKVQVGPGTSAQRSNVSIGGYTYNEKLLVDQFVTMQVGGNIGAAQVKSNGVLKVSGNVTQYVDFEKNSQAYAGGSIAGNSNGMSSGGVSIYAGGTIGGAQNANGANVNQNYKYAGQPGAAPGAVAAPTAPTAPVVNSLTDTTAQMNADLQALSAHLAGLTVTNNPSYITWGAQGPTFNAVSSGGANPFAVFTVDESIFNFTEVNYNFGNSTLPVIINVVNSNAATSAAKAAEYVWRLNPVGGANSQHNQQVIWNFTDAAKVDFRTSVQGSVLAVYAQVLNTSDLNGSVVAKSMKQGGEVHLGTFNGFLDHAAIPEPATWAMMLTGFGLIGGAVRRRRRQERLALAA